MPACRLIAGAEAAVAVTQLSLISRWSRLYFPFLAFPPRQYSNAFKRKVTWLVNGPDLHALWEANRIGAYQMYPCSGTAILYFLTLSWVGECVQLAKCSHIVVCRFPVVVSGPLGPFNPLKGSVEKKQGIYNSDFYKLFSLRPCSVPLQFKGFFFLRLYPMYMQTTTRKSF